MSTLADELMDVIEFPSAVKPSYGDPGVVYTAVADRRTATLAVLERANTSDIKLVLEAAHMLHAVGWRVKRPRDRDGVSTVNDREWATHCWYWIGRSLEHVRERGGLKVGGVAIPQPAGGVKELAAGIAGVAMAHGAMAVPPDSLRKAWAAGMAWLDYVTYLDCAAAAPKPAAAEHAGPSPVAEAMKRGMT